MADDALLVARLLFWSLAAGVVFLPPRWALFCFVVAAHIDITSSTFTSATAIGFDNSVRIAVLPALLFLRTGFSLKDLAWNLPQKLWIALLVYAGIASAWGGFVLSGFKMVIYLIAYLVLYAVFCSAWANRWFDVGMIRLAAWCAIGLALVQTLMLGNTLGGPEERFTSFSTPQYFAACLVAWLAILIFSGERGIFHYATCAAIVVAIVLSGSRYVFVSTVVLLIVACFQVVSSGQESVRWRLSLPKILVTLGLVCAGIALLLSYLPYNRIDELASAASEDGVGVQEVGTFAWRLGIYAEIFSRLEERSPSQLFFGSGTGSGGSLIIDYEPARYDPEGVDANRVLHSEFLRALYEWGILGFGLLCAFLVATAVAFGKRISVQGGRSALAFFGVLPSIVLGLAIENVLAGAASAAGVGILLAMSFAWEMPALSVAETELSESPSSDGSLLPA